MNFGAKVDRVHLTSSAFAVLGTDDCRNLPGIITAFRAGALLVQALILQDVRHGLLMQEAALVLDLGGCLGRAAPTPCPDRARDQREPDGSREGKPHGGRRRANHRCDHGRGQRSRSLVDAGSQPQSQSALIRGHRPAHEHEEHRQADAMTDSKQEGAQVRRRNRCKHGRQGESGCAADERERCEALDPEPFCEPA